MCVCVEGGGIPEKPEEKEVAKERERGRERGELKMGGGWALKLHKRWC